MLKKLSLYGYIPATEARITELNYNADAILVSNPVSPFE